MFISYNKGKGNKLGILTNKTATTKNYNYHINKGLSLRGGIINDKNYVHVPRPYLNKIRVLQELVLEAEISLLSLAPGSLIIKVDVGSLLIVIRDRLGLLVTLEPCQVLLVEPP